MFYYENEVTGAMDETKLWDLYSNVTKWAAWDSSIDKVELNGEFVKGSTGVMHMHGMPPLPFTLEDVETGKTFINSSSISGITVQFGHFIAKNENGTYTIKHTVTMTGAEDGKLQGMGKGIVSNIPASMAKLCALAKAE